MGGDKKVVVLKESTSDIVDNPTMVSFSNLDISSHIFKRVPPTFVGSYQPQVHGKLFPFPAVKPWEIIHVTWE